MDEPGDPQLIARFKAGDRSAYDLLVDRYMGRIVGLARRSLGDAHEAQDVAQEVFFEAYKTLPAWREEGSFFSWLYRTTLNLSSHRLRRRGKVVLADVPPESTASDASPEQTARRAELAEAVAQAVSALPPRQREVFLLRHDRGLPLARVAGELNISVGAAKSHLHRALASIRDRLRFGHFL